MIGLAGKYQQANKYQYPPDDVDPKEKATDAFMLRAAQALFSQYVRNETLIPYEWGTRRSIDELRAYGHGRQPVTKYKDWLCNPESSVRKLGIFWDNMSWDIVQIIPKFREIVRGRLMQIDFDVATQAIGPQAQMDRSLEQNIMKLETNRDWKRLKTMTQMAGVKLPGKRPEFATEEQVDLYFSTGGARTRTEAAVADLILLSKWLSKGGVINDQIIDDLIDIGKCAVMDYTNRLTGKAMFKYCDIKRVITRNSQYNDFRNVDYQGYIEKMTIQELREQTQLSNAVLAKIAKTYAKENGNAAFRVQEYGYYNTTYFEQHKSQHGVSPIDDYKIDVLEGFFISADIEKYTELMRPSTGNLSFNQVDFDYQLTQQSKQDGKKVMQTKPHRLYHFKWIVGTEVVFDIGYNKHTVYTGEAKSKRPVLPISIISTGSSSIVERMVPNADEIQLSTLKWRNAKIKAPPPPRMVVNKDALENVTLGKTKMSPLALKELFQQDGYLITQTLSDHGMPVGNQNKVVDFLPTGIAEDFKIWTADIAFNVDQIRQTTGVNEISDGSSSNPEMLVGVAQQLQASTNNALYPITNAYQIINDRLAENLVKRWQLLALTQEVGGSFPMGEAMRVVKAGAEIAWEEFAIILRSKPSKEETDHLLLFINQQKQKREETGAGGLDLDAYLMLYNTIKTGNLKLAQLMMTQAVKQQQQLDSAMATKQMQENAQVQQQSNQAAVQAEMQKGQLMAGVEIEKEKELSKIRNDEATHQHELDMELERLKLGAKSEQIQEQGNLDRSKERVKSLQTS